MPDDRKVLLRLNNVGVSYRKALNVFSDERHQALSGLDFELYSGETLGVLGRNGAGKSTLMALLADIIAPDEGTIDRYTHRVQLLSLRTGFIPYLTGRENVVMAGLLLGLRRRDIESRMNSIIDFSGLGDKIDDPLRTYSHGMMARLGFAISIQTDPDVLLIDEILGVGDAAFKPKAVQVINERVKGDETVVIVSHVEQTLEDYCERVAWIDGGHLRMIGPAAEVIAAYRDSLAGG